MGIELPAERMDTGTDQMVAFVQAGVGWMVFNNPERLNAVTFAMKLAVPAILEAFERDDNVRVVVITGAGDRAFVSGADISEFGERRSTPEAIREYDRVTDRMWESLRAVSKPMIAMVRGYALGGGLETALRADLRVASEDAQFGIPAVKIGLGFSYHNTEELLHAMGPTRTADMLLTGRRFSAAEALEAGLVNRVVPAASLERTVRELATEVAANAPLAVRLVKANMREARKPEAARDLTALAALAAECYASEDYAEGRRAFAEKRTPQFRGR
ncbi:MAG: enoyl-CoA hydratase [Dehalococcoidia bacterium]|nr:enoyl-CoA hydratase [Dehalococcoidia bacterium]